MSAPVAANQVAPAPVAAAPAPVVAGVVVAAPVQVAQYDPTNIETYFGRGVIMTQKTSQCCRCCCLQPNIHWQYAPLTEEIETLSQSSGVGAAIQGKTHMHVQEDAPYCGRTLSWCYPGFRPTRFTVHAGNDESGPMLFTHEKEMTCGVTAVVGVNSNGQVIRVPCCCNLPYLTTKDANGQALGKSHYLCDECLCIPKYSITDPSGQVWYVVRPDACPVPCCCCVNFKCGGKKARCCRIPFYIRDPATRDKLDGGEAYISDLWAGWTAECCTQRDLYGIKFPSKATTAQKATILGCAHLIDITWNEQEGAQGGDS